jgi:hypothetical protein
MAEKFVQMIDNLPKPKKIKLECEEKPVSPTNIKKRNTPLSFSVEQELTVFFQGYRFPYDTNKEGGHKYYCAECMLNRVSFKPGENKNLFLEHYISTGELPLDEFHKRLYSRTDSCNICAVCEKLLTVVRPYDSAHLDFQ